MAQQLYMVETLPEGSLDASAAFFADHLESAKALLKDPQTSALTIVLPAANADHDGWRTSLARDLARKFTPARVNVVSGSAGSARDAVLAYLGNANGVTGHYCAAHE
jgi:hypothetical protein